MFIIERKVEGKWVLVGSSEMSIERQKHTNKPEVFGKAEIAREELVKIAKRHKGDFDYRVIRRYGNRAVYVVSAANVRLWKEADAQRSVNSGSTFNQFFD